MHLGIVLFTGLVVLQALLALRRAPTRAKRGPWLPWGRVQLRAAREADLAQALEDLLPFLHNGRALRRRLELWARRLRLRRRRTPHGEAYVRRGSALLIRRERAGYRLAQVLWPLEVRGAAKAAPPAPARRHGPPPPRGGTHP